MTKLSLSNHDKLAELSRDELLATVQHLVAESESLSSRILAINEIGMAINRTFDFQEILRIVSRQAEWILQFDHLSVCYYEGASNLTIQTLFGEPAHLNHPQAILQSNLGEVLQKGHSLLIQETPPDSFLEGYGSQIIIPLTGDEQVIGTLNFAQRDDDCYGHEDMRMGYLLALQMSAAIRNADFVRQHNNTRLELEQYTRELEQINLELEGYSRTIAHDLQSPLSVIPMKVSLVKRYLPHIPPKAEEHLNDIVQRTHHMSEMINQLLVLAKLRDSTDTLMRVNTEACVQNALSRFPAVEMGEVNISLPEQYPRVLGQQQWIEEVFANLISNAIKYMGNANPNPSIDIRVKPLSNERQIRFEVEDNGIGIQPDDQTKLFQMFTRLHTVDVEGIGLGLSIVQRIVARLSGKVGVHSVFGKGSIFWFTLPSADFSMM